MAASIADGWKQSIQKWPPNRCISVLCRSLKSINDSTLKEKEAILYDCSLEILKRLRILLQLTSYQQQIESASKSSLILHCINFLHRNQKDDLGAQLFDEIYSYTKSILFQINFGSGLISKVKETTSDDFVKIFEPVKQFTINNRLEENQASAAVPFFCQLMLREVLQWKSEDSAKIHFKFLSQLCSLFGFTDKSSVLDDEMLVVIAEFLAMFSNPATLPVSASLSNNELKSWLYSLVSCLLDKPCVHTAWYKCIVAAIQIEPSIAMSKSGDLFSKCFIKVKDENWNADLDGLMNQIVKTYGNLRQMPKLIFAVLTSIKNVSKAGFTNDDVPVLSSCFIKKIEVTFLPPGQIFQIWDDLLNTCSFFINANKREGCSTGSIFGYIKVLQFFRYFLSMVKLADNSLPMGLVPKLHQLMKSTCQGTINETFDFLMINRHEPSLINAILDLTYTWGELELLLHQYCFRYKSAVSLDHCNNSDLLDTSLIHSYNSGGSINKLVYDVMHSDNKSMQLRVFQLMMQRLRCLFLFFNDDKNCDSIITDIIDKICSEVNSTEILKDENEELRSKDFGTVVALLLLDNMKICYMYLKRKQLNVIIDRVIWSQRNESLFNLLKCGESLSQGLEACLISSMLSALSETIIFRGVKRDSSPSKSTPPQDLNVLFKISSINKNFELNSTEKMIEILRRKFSSIQNLASRKHGKNSLNLDSSRALEILCILRSLPLEFLSPGDTVDLYIAMLTLYMLNAYSKKCDINVMTETTCLLSALTSCLRNQNLLVQCCDCPAVLSILTSSPCYQVNSNDYKEMLMSFILVIMKDKSSFEALENFITKTHNAQIPSLILTLMETFTKGIDDNIGSTRLSRAYFWTLAQAFVPPNTVSTEIIKSYRLIVEVANSKDKFIGNQTKIPDWKAFILEIRKTVFQMFGDNKDLTWEMESLMFVSTLWRHKAMVISQEEEVEILNGTLKMLIRHHEMEKSNETCNLVHEQCLKNLVDNCSTGSLVSGLKAISSTLNDKDCKFSSLLRLWGDVVSTCHGEEKLKALIPAVDEVLPKAYSSISIRGTLSDDDVEFASALIQLQIKSASHDKILSIETINGFLQSLQSHNINFLYENKKFAQLFHIMALYCDLLNELLMKHTKQVLHASPVFISIVNQLLHLTVLCADQELVLENQCELEIMKLASAVKRLMILFASHKKHVDKILCFVVSKYVYSVCKVTVLPAVKNVLQQGIHACLASAHPQTIDHLRVASSSSTHEVFKSMYENFVSHYKYTGKV